MVGSAAQQRIDARDERGVEPFVQPRAGRNVITCTVIIAAGMFAAHHPLQAPTPATWSVHFAGHVASAVGVLLLLLNLCDGLRSLARRRHPVLLHLAMVLAYVGLSVRLVQVFMLFRLPL